MVVLVDISIMYRLVHSLATLRRSVIGRFYEASLDGPRFLQEIS